MNTISHHFASLRSLGQCALIPFIVAGDPDLETTARALQTLDTHGADLIELGVPYSDPLADGPVIQAAATRALKRGTRFEPVLEVVASVSPRLRSPLILFTYYNPILHRGVQPFLKRIARAGVAGLVVPDLPLEESEHLLNLASEQGIEVTLLVTPMSPGERIRAIAQKSQGFIYLVSVTGVTGMREHMGTQVQSLLQELRQVTDKPVGVGFGISQPEHARQVKAWGADAVIVGSAIVKRLADRSPEQGLTMIGQFCQELKASLQSERTTV